MWAQGGTAALHGFLQAHLLIGAEVGKQRDQAYPWLLHPWPHAMQRGRLSDRGVHDALLQQPLHLMQQRFALAAIALQRLLLEQRIDIGIAAIGVDTRAEP